MHRPTYLAHLTHVSSQSSKVKIMHKPAATDIALHELIRNRWSPRAFSDKPVPSEVLRSLFEAARWAPSSNNEQPWAYLVATKDDPENFAKMVGVLVEFNANWANHAPVLALSVAHLKTQRDGKPNRVALHDVGSATAQLTFEANARGLQVHQMAGFDAEKARQTFAIPPDWEPVAAMAIGYPGNPESLPEKLRDRELAPRTRKPLGEFVMTGGWGHTAPFVAT
ncbi:MAG TPA: nitroreductase family protein [Candidatus Acidoferrum sp.]|nr:nitroreductase family protein [Candidatus Acidoferrum sp.]